MYAEIMRLEIYVISKQNVKSKTKMESNEHHISVMSDVIFITRKFHKIMYKNFKHLLHQSAISIIKRSEIYCQVFFLLDKFQVCE